MTRSELKQLIRETIEESLVQEGLPFGKSEVGHRVTSTLTTIMGKFVRPDLEDKARIHAAEIIRLIDEDQEWAHGRR
jgi:hypothetical protein